MGEIKFEQEDKLLITPIFKSNSIFRKIGYKKIISNSNFESYIKIKNINNLPFDGAVIKNIIIQQMGKESGAIVSDQEVKIPLLNPNELIVIKLERSFSPFSGNFLFKFDLNNSKQIQTYQWDKANKCPAKCILKNKYENVFIIKDEGVFQQEITNLVLIILTVLQTFSIVKSFISP